jgi:hypothetical protein
MISAQNRRITMITNSHHFKGKQCLRLQGIRSPRWSNYPAMETSDLTQGHLLGWTEENLRRIVRTRQRVDAGSS